MRDALYDLILTLCWTLFLAMIVVGVVLIVATVLK